jgi:hypothetical protein
MGQLGNSNSSRSTSSLSKGRERCTSQPAKLKPAVSSSRQTSRFRPFYFYRPWSKLCPTISNVVSLPTKFRDAGVVGEAVRRELHNCIRRKKHVHDSRSLIYLPASSSKTFSVHVCSFTLIDSTTRDECQLSNPNAD